MKRLEILENEKIVLIKEKIVSDFVCLYPNGWKVENKLVMPSVIHHEESLILDKSRELFDKLCNYDTTYTKIFLLCGVSNDIFIHSNGIHKKIVHPEDEVNGVHIMKEEDLEKFLKYKNDYIEKRIFSI